MSLLGSAFELTIVGMGVVFLSLLGLKYVIELLNRASTAWNHREHWSEAKSEAEPETEPAGEEGDLSLVLAAAAGYFLDTERAEVFIPELTRNHESSWARRARTGSPITRRPR